MFEELLWEKKKISYLEFWAKSATENYIRAENELQPIS